MESIGIGIFTGFIIIASCLAAFIQWYRDRPKSKSFYIYFNKPYFRKNDIISHSRGLVKVIKAYPKDVTGSYQLKVKPL